MRSEVRYDSCMEQRLLDPVYGGTVRADRVEPGNLFAGDEISAENEGMEWGKG